MIYKSDEELWDCIKRNDKAAFEQLYTLYSGILINYGRQLTENDELVKDVVQKIYIDIWEKSATRSTPNNIKSYLIKSCRNNLFREIKREQKMTDIEINNPLLAISAIDLYENSEYSENRINKIKLAINKLPLRQKEIIHLRYFQGIKNNEISEILNINAQSTANLLQRSITKLKTLIFKMDKNSNSNP